MEDLWEKMKQEFKEHGAPGKLWHQEIQIIAARKIRRLHNVPPSTFGLPDWNKDDLTQIVITERLISRGQGSYIFHVADTIEDARRLLATELNFSLDDIRVPNQVDNVWSNLSGRLERLGWNPLSKGAEGSSHQDADLELLVRLIINQKRMKNQGVERLSPLFAGGVLDKLAGEIMEISPHFSEDFLRTALRQALTIISPALSIESVGTSSEDYREAGVYESEGEGRIGSEQEAHRAFAREICKKLAPEDLEILFHLANRSSQSEIASNLGISRPTAVKRIQEFTSELTQMFTNLGVVEDDKLSVFREILDFLGVGMSEGELIK